MGNRWIFVQFHTGIAGRTGDGQMSPAGCPRRARQYGMKMPDFPEKVN